MLAIKTYQEVKAEYEMVKSRYEYLEDKRKALYQRLLGLHSPSLENNGSKGNGSSELGDKVSQYVFEYEEKKQRNGKTLKEEIEALYLEMLALEALLASYEEILSHLSGIDYQLFYKIGVEGLKPNKAVEEVAETNGYSERQVWRIYNYVKILLESIKKRQGE